MVNQRVSLKQQPKKLFYGYIVVAVAVGIQMVMWGIYNSAYGVFFVPLLTEFSWSRATISGAASLGQIVVGLGSIFIGHLNDRLSPRMLMTLCGILAGLGYFLMSQVNSVWQLYLFYGGIVGIGVSATDVVTLSTIARWFVKRRGTMSGIAKMGTGVGMMIVPFVVTWLIYAYGWRTSYIVVGITVLICVVSCAQLLRRDPAKMQQLPDGREIGHSANLHLEETGLPLRQAIHTRQFWTLCLAYLTIFFCVQTVLVHIAPHAVDLQLSVSFAATVLAVIGGTSIISRLIMGIAGDRIGNRRALLICFAILIAALLWLQLAGGLWSLSLFALAYGFCHGGFFALMSPIVAEFFGTRSHGLIFGIVVFSGSVGGFLGPLVTGYIFDTTTSYHVAFLLLLALAIIGFILILSLGSAEQKPAT